MSESSLEVCLLTSGPTLPDWAARAVRRMLTETRAELTLIVEDGSSTDRTTMDRLRRLAELREWGLVAGAKSVLGADREPLERRPIDGLPGSDDAAWITCEPETVDGWKHELPPSAVGRIAETDVAVRLGFGFLVGDALDAPRMGVLSFHHGDIREYRGQPMGFWEYVHGQDVGAITLQRLNETLDGGEIVCTRTVDIADAPTWGALRERLFGASEPMLAEGLRRLDAAEGDLETLTSEELGPLYTHPRGRPVFTFLGKTVLGILTT